MELSHHKLYEIYLKVNPKISRKCIISEEEIFYTRMKESDWLLVNFLILNKLKTSQ